MADVTYTKKNVLTCDLIALRHVSAKDLQKEHALARSCWWEYRGEHPTNRTLRFIAHFIETSQRFHGKYRNYSNMDKVSGLRGDSVFPSVMDDDAAAKSKKTNLTGLWRARQTADELCISYSIYLSAIFEKAAMAGWTYMPRPVQLYSDAMKMVALDEQVKEIERFIPDFRNENLKAGSTAPFKREFDEWLFELGALRRQHKELAFNRMADQGYITHQQATAWADRAREVA